MESLPKAILYLLKPSDSVWVYTVRTNTITAVSKPCQNFPEQKRFTTANCTPLKKHPGCSSCCSSASELGVKKDEIDATTSLSNPSALFLCKLHLYSRSKVNIFPCYNSLNFSFYSHDSYTSCAPQEHKLIASVRYTHFFNTSSEFLPNSPRHLAALLPSPSAAC